MNLRKFEVLCLRTKDIDLELIQSTLRIQIEHMVRKCAECGEEIYAAKDIGNARTICMHCTSMFFVEPLKHELTTC